VSRNVKVVGRRPSGACPPAVVAQRGGQVAGRTGEVAVILLGGDKTELGNRWYPANLNEAEHRLDQYCRHHKDISPIVKRGNR
jgi:hypothetical protein